MDELITWKHKKTGKSKTLTYEHACRVLKNYKGSDLECTSDNFAIVQNELIKQPKKKKVKKSEE